MMTRTSSHVAKEGMALELANVPAQRRMEAHAL
jgi:hypothetical protein